MIDLSEHDNTVFKGAMDVALLDHKSRLYQMWVLWKEYIDFHVVANDHIKKIMFFNLIGVILTYKKYGYFYTHRINLQLFLLESTLK